MTPGERKTEILQTIREARVDLADTSTRETVRAAAEQLSNLTFTTMSDCGMVTVVQDGAGALADITFSEQAFRIYDSRRMAQVITLTIQNGEGVIREALREASDEARRTGQ